MQNFLEFLWRHKQLTHVAPHPSKRLISRGLRGEGYGRGCRRVTGGKFPAGGGLVTGTKKWGAFRHPINY